MSIRKIFKTLYHPTTIKIVALIVIVGFFFIHPAFAQGTDTTTTGTLQSLQELLDKFISICSRGRVILAILAGKLMTNDFVYGAFLHMDVYLWKIRNIMKNFANFTLVALVLRSIIKNIISKEGDLKKIITNTLVAGVLIQASRFLMGAVIDLSTVATAGISSFPIAFLNNDAGLKGEMNDAISGFNNERIVIDLTATNNEIKAIPITGGTQSSADLRKNMLPSYNSISGPFIFLGMGVFNFQKYLTIGNADTVPTLTLEFALRFLLLFFFTISLLLLVIANIMRIGLLRVFIIGAPFLILIQVFGKSKTEGGGGILGMFSLSNLIATIFKPVIFVIGISLMLIVIVSMQHGILYSSSQRENNLNGVTLGVTGTTSTLAIEGITNVEVNQQGFLGKGVIDEGKNIFSQLLMLLLTMFLMRRFVKLSLTLGGGTIGETMKGLITKAETMAKSAPVLPFKGGVASLTAVKGFAEGQRTKFMQEGFGMSTKGEFTEAERNFQNMVDEQFLGIKSSWATADYQDLQKIINTDGDFMGASIALGKKKSEGLSLSLPSRKAELEAWLTKISKDPTKRTAAKLKYGFKGQYVDFDTFLDKEGKNPDIGKANRTALHIAMGGDAADNAVNKREDLKNITYDQLLNNVYHQSTK